MTTRRRSLACIPRGPHTRRGAPWTPVDRRVQITLYIITRLDDYPIEINYNTTFGRTKQLGPRTTVHVRMYVYTRAPATLRRRGWFFFVRFTAEQLLPIMYIILYSRQMLFIFVLCTRRVRKIPRQNVLRCVFRCHGPFKRIAFEIVSSSRKSRALRCNGPNVVATYVNTIEFPPKSWSLALVSRFGWFR